MTMSKMAKKRQLAYYSAQSSRRCCCVNKDHKRSNKAISDVVFIMMIMKIIQRQYYVHSFFSSSFIVGDGLGRRNNGFVDFHLTKAQGRISLNAAMNGEKVVTSSNDGYSDASRNDGEGNGEGGGYSLDYGNIPMTTGNSNSPYYSGYNTDKEEYERFLYSRTRRQRQKRIKKAMREKSLKNKIEDEDGYGDMMRSEIKLKWWQSAMIYPLKVFVNVANKGSGLITGTELLTRTEPGRLILVRHGESEWNANKTFTGWADPDLSDKGIRETEHAARLLLAGGYDIDVVFTSRLKRAIRSSWIILGELNQLYLPVFKSWRLNERMYGALTGLGKTETAKTLGVNLVQKWRGSLKSRPPALRPNDIYWPGRDRRYSDLSPNQIPLTESLEDCMIRTKPVWEDKIKFELMMGRNVMVVGHANTLRGLVKLIDEIGDEEIQEVAIPTGIPIVYKFNKKTMKPIHPASGDEAEGTSSSTNNLLTQKHMSGLFLEKPGLLKQAMEREKEWCDNVPGFNRTMTRSSRTSMTHLERSLYKLQAIGELGEWAAQFFDPNAHIDEDDGSDGNMGKPIQFMNQEDVAWEVGMKQLQQHNNNNAVASGAVASATNNGESQTISSSSSGQTFKHYGGLETTTPFDGAPIPPPLLDIDDDEEDELAAVTTVPTIISNPCTIKVGSSGSIKVGDEGDEMLSSSSSTDPTNVDALSTVSSFQLNEDTKQQQQQQTFTNTPTIRRDPVLVLIRHGKTEHNKLGLFTGWEDAPLAPEGRAEATAAGKLLREHGFEFDLVYTSWLSRAIETAWLVMEQLDATWLPIIKTWRLNERMYGALTGKSKAMIAQKYGEKQFKAWRRGYTVKPPRVSSFSLDYPGNDVRYKYLNDVRISISESIMRSFDSGKLTVHRKLPKTESLKDCMDRTIPYFKAKIFPEALDGGKRVLISSSENAIRGLLMDLCEIPEEEISGLEIPNGLPLVYDIKSRCIKLLDDGNDENPLERYNFGKAAPYLFRPCRDEDGNEDEECSIDVMFPSSMKKINDNGNREKEDAVTKSRKEILKDVGITV